MACVYKQTKLIRPHDPYLLIAPHAHPNNCGRVKRKATHKRPFAYLMGNMVHVKTASKDHQNPQWEQSQTSKRAKNRQKTGKKIDFFLTVSPCEAFKKSSKRA